MFASTFRWFHDVSHENDFTLEPHGNTGSRFQRKKESQPTYRRVSCGLAARAAWFHGKPAVGERYQLRHVDRYFAMYRRDLQLVVAQHIGKRIEKALARAAKETTAAQAAEQCLALDRPKTAGR